jgi:hypothetical protein
MIKTGKTNGTAARGSLETVASLTEDHRKPYLDRLETIYAHMDRKYHEVADQYGFNCRGCKDSCCRTTFYHHTLVEYLYLKVGVQALGKEKQAGILKQAKKISEHPDALLFCPLNEAGRCLLYAFRPMICRLHGIAHELRRPNGTVEHGPGCSVFEAAAGGRAYVPFDRSGFYWELSMLEREARTAFGFYGKIKMTVSQMVETMLNTRLLENNLSHETN